ncbi:hypothetical protein ACQB6R_05775 [Propionibacteriaceae bacterium G1746]
MYTLLPGGTLQDVRDALTALFTTQSSVWSSEHQVARDAVNKLDWRHCADKKRFWREVDRLERKLAGEVRQLKETYRLHFQPKDSVPEKLMANHHEPWGQILAEAASIEQDLMLFTSAETWQSKGADIYKAAQPAQLKALRELQGVAIANQQAVEDVAMLNAAIFEVTQQTIDLVAQDILVDAGEQAGKQRDTDWFGFGSGNVKGYYFQASWNAAARLRQLDEWMIMIADASASPWAGGATELGTAIKQVEDSPANLGPEGYWPPAIAQTTPDAHTGALGQVAAGQGLTHGSTQREGSGVKLR